MRARELSILRLVNRTVCSALHLIVAMFWLVPFAARGINAQGFPPDYPPQISNSPIAGTVTTGSLPVTVDWCDDHGFIQHSDSLNGVNITSSLTYVTATSTPPRCTFHRQSTGTLSLTPGNNRFVIYGIDTHSQGGPGTTIYRYTTVQVSASYQPPTPQRSTIVDSFTVKNLLSTSQTIDLAAVCTGHISGCSAPASVTISSLGQARVAVSFATDTNGLAGGLYLKAWQAANSALRDSAFSGVTAVPSVSADFSFDNNDNQPAGLCAVNCFAATASYSTVPYFSLGTARSVSLMHNGDQVAVRPFVYADVSIFSGSTVPQEFWLQVKDSASGAFLSFTNGDTTKVRYAGTLSPVRLVAQVNASQYPTSMRTVYVTVTAVRSAYNEQYTFTTKLRIVNERTSSVARGWTIGGLQRLYVQADGTVLLTDGNGSATYFSGGCTAPCTLISPTGDFTRLRATGLIGSTTYVREYVDSTKVFFRSSGLMDSVADRFGNKVRFEYDASNRLSKVYDPYRTYNSGASRSFTALTYGTFGLTQIQEPGADGSPSGGRITQVRVASDSTLTAIIDPDGDSSRYTYDTSKRLQSIVDRAGNSRSYVYDATSWKIISIVAPQVSVDAGGGSTTLATPTTSLAAWQLVGLPVSTTAVTAAPTVRADTIQAEIIDPAGRVSRFTIDRWGQPLIVTEPMNRVTAIARSGTLDTSITYPNGRRDRVLYTGALPRMVQPFGHDSTIIAYGAYGQVHTTSGPNQPTLTNFIGTTGVIDSSEFGSNNYTTRYAYDSFGRVVRTLDPGKDTVSIHYETKFGNADTLRAPGGRYVFKRFDGRGRDSTAIALGGATTTTLYDSIGRVRQFNDGVHANPTTLSYDKLNLIRIEDPQHQVYRFAINPLGWRTATYDPADTLSRFTSYRYRADGVLTSLTNRRAQRIDFVYDSVGRLLSKRGPSNIVADSFAYNSQGTVILALNATSRDSIFLDGTGWADSTVTRFVADPSKRFHVSVRHDSQYRPTSLGIDTVAGITFPSRTFVWNSGTGLLTSIVLGTKTISVGVDNEGRRDSTTYEGALRRVDVFSTVHTVFQSSYNVAAIDTAFWRGYGVDSLGRMSQQSKHNGTGTLVSKYDYSANSELRRDQELTSTSGPDQCRGFGLKNDFGGSCLGMPGLTQSALLGFTYDSASNLTEERDSVAGTSIIGRYAVGNRDTSWAGVSYTYDLDGNRLRKRTGSDSVRFFWSADNRLDSVYSGGLRVHYEYNALGQLVRKSRNGVADRALVWAHQQLLVELNGSLNSRISEYAYAPNSMDQPIALMTGGTSVSATRYPQQDALGNVLGLASLSTVSEQVNYSPRGQASFNIGAAVADTNRLQWKGLRWESDSTELYFARARWYDPAQGRFVSEDPLGLRAGINEYSFASNDPIDGSDSEGLDGECPTNFRPVSYNYGDGDVFQYCERPGGDPGDSNGPSFPSSTVIFPPFPASLGPQIGLLDFSGSGSAVSAGSAAKGSATSQQMAQSRRDCVEAALAGASDGFIAGAVVGAGTGAALGATAGWIAGVPIGGAVGTAVGILAGAWSGPGDLAFAIVGGETGAVEGGVLLSGAGAVSGGVIFAQMGSISYGAAGAVAGAISCAVKNALRR